jgi:hypothetical protein
MEPVIAEGFCPLQYESAPPLKNTEDLRKHQILDQNISQEARWRDDASVYTRILVIIIEDAIPRRLLARRDRFCARSNGVFYHPVSFV